MQGFDSAPALSSARRLRLLALYLFVAATFVGTTAWAQVQQGLGALSGTVTDSSKAAIPGAHVTLVNPSIGYRKESVTNASGQYTFSPLTVAGGYNLDVAVAGFASASVKNITTSVGTVITQDVTLAVGSESTVIEVAGANEEQVQVDTSSLSQVIDSTVWQNSPLETRSQNSFVGLVAGAAPDSANTGRGFAIDGARTGAGNFLADGYDNNDQGLGGGASGGAVAVISPDAIQEFRVIASTPPAEYGRSGGFATDTVLKSGTNQFHGSAFEYNRNQAITANNFFSKRNNLIDHLVRNQFGGSYGGPIYRDKTFVFVTAEFYRNRQGAPTAGIVGTTADFIDFVKTGKFEQFMEGTNYNDAATGVLGACPYNDGNTCPGLLARAATLGPIFTQLYAAEPKAFPLATTDFTNVGQGLYTSGTIFPVNVYGTTAVTDTTSEDQNRGSVRLDHKLTEHDQLSFTYLADLHKSNYSDGGGNSTPGVPYVQVGGAQLFGATYIHTFSPTLVNVFKASYLRHVSNFEAPGTTGVPSTLAVDSLYTGFGASNGFPQLFTENQFGYEDSISKTLGRHIFKAGFSFKRTRNGSSFYNDVNGLVEHWSVEGLLTDGVSDADLDGTGTQPAQDFSAGLGALYYASASLDPTTGLAPDPYRGYRANEFSAYAQDDFKVSNKLTLNYGIRWDYFGPPHNFRGGIDSNVYFGAFGAPTATGNPFLPSSPLAGAEQGASFQLAQANGRSTIWNRDTNNFAPRAGFAYDALGNQKVVLRGGFGIGFDRLYNNVYENIRFNAPHFVDNGYGYGSGNGTVIDEGVRTAVETAPFTGNTALAGTGAAVPRHIDQRLVTAYYEQAHLGVESALPKGFVLETNYVLTLGRKLVGLSNANTFAGRAACPVATYTAKSTGQGARCFAAGYTTGFSTKRLSTAFSNDNFRTNGFSSNYNGFQASLRKGYSNGLQLTANYTFSKAMDEVSDVFTIKSAATGVTDSYNPSYDYGPADFDTRHLFVLTANYQTHSAKHKLLLAGWGFSPILTIHSGSPLDIIDGNSGYSPNKNGSTGVQRAVYLGTGSPKNSINHKISPADGYLKPVYNGTPGSAPQSWSSLAQKSHDSADGSIVYEYNCPTNVNNGLWCDPPVQRNSIYGPSDYNLDAAISKHLTFRERYSFTLQAAFFDVDNHAEFGNPVANTNSSNFGQSTSASNRTGQVSARVDF